MKKASFHVIYCVAVLLGVAIVLISQSVRAENTVIVNGKTVHGDSIVIVDGKVVEVRWWEKAGRCWKERHAPM